MRRLTDNSLELNELLNKAKFEHAKDMLRDTIDPITEIAKSLGYSDAVLFMRAFHRWSGNSPTEYRKKIM